MKKIKGLSVLLSVSMFFASAAGVYAQGDAELFGGTAEEWTDGGSDAGKSDERIVDTAGIFDSGIFDAGVFDTGDTDISNEEIFDQLKADYDYVSSKYSLEDSIQTECVWMSMETDEEELFHEWAITIDDGDKILIDTASVSGFANYYFGHYCFGPNAGYNIHEIQNGDGTSLVYLTACPSGCDREKCISRIVDEYGDGITSEGEEAVCDIYERVHENIVYDIAYLNCGMMQCLDDGRGTCWTMACCIAALLNYCGVPAQRLSGYANGVKHSWIRFYLDGSWHYLDSTSDSFAISDEPIFEEADFL